MHWIVTTPRDAPSAELHGLLVRTGTPHTVVRGGAVRGTIVPDVSPDGPVICLGSHALAIVAHAKGWIPGAVDVGWLGYSECVEAWGDAMLNADAWFVRFDALETTASAMGLASAFVRPAYDTKAFEARVVRTDRAGWTDSLDGTPPPDTPSLIATPREVLAEWRTWIVRGRVATASLYRRGGRPLFDGRDVPDGVTAFAGRCATILADRHGGDAPEAYVLDVALVDDGYRIVEVNGIAGARLYDCDPQRLFGSLDELGADRSLPTP